MNYSIRQCKKKSKKKEVLFPLKYNGSVIGLP
jgi:hypothetical protein